MFISYDETFEPKHHFIELADGHRSNDLAIARGDAKFTLRDTLGNTANVILKGALLAPKFPTSLFAVRAATDAGAEVVFLKGAAELIAKGTHFSLIRRGQLYFLPTTITTSAHVTRTLNDWHRTLGHMNYNDILCLQSATEGMKISQRQQERTCTTCMQNKLTRTPKSYLDTPLRADKPLQRVHTDICGPIEPQSREGYRYVINFVDEHSSMLFVYFLQSKDEASQGLKAFLADVAPFGYPKEIHSDNGTEYVKTFQQILRDNCIKHTTTAPYSPFQNGKSERNWRSLMEMARCLVTDASLPKFLWPYAVRHAQYLRNRSFQRRTGTTAYELFMGVKPDMRHVHPFGATCTIFIEGQKQKLSARGQEGTFLGVNPTSQGYYILNRTNSIVTTSRNVRIHDTSAEIDDHSYTVPPQSTVTETKQHNDAERQDSSVKDEHPEEILNKTDEEQEIQGRPQRGVKRPEYLKDYYCTTNVDYACTAIPVIPETFEQAISSPDAEHWKAAMDAEINMLTENHTWEIKPLPSDRVETKGRWVYTIKQGKQQNEVTYKARYVAKGYSQIHGVDYDETFSPTTRFTTIRMILQKAVNESLHLHQMDVKGAYLNAPIDKDVYVQQPQGYERTDGSNTPLTCHLKKSLYGLKQSGRNWHHTLTDFLKSKGFTVTDTDPCVYTQKTKPGDQLIVIFWVDIILASNNITAINTVKQELSERFKMDDRGELRWFLGVDFKRLPDGRYMMSQERYAETVLRRFNMHDCNPVNTPAEKGLQLTEASDEEHQKFVKRNFPYRSAIGSLIYLMAATRPDIAWTVSKLSQFLEKPGIAHISAVKRLMKYIQGTKSYCLIFAPSDGQLIGHIDADWANDPTDRRSTTGYLFTLGSAPVSWRTRKQPTVALSSCEAEYMALAEATKEAIYLRNLSNSINLPQATETTVYCDNQGTLALTKNSARQHNRTKHIDVRYHFVREQSEVTFRHVPTCDNLADFLTKSLGTQQHRHLLSQLQIEGAC